MPQFSVENAEANYVDFRVIVAVPVGRFGSGIKIAEHPKQTIGRRFNPELDRFLARSRVEQANDITSEFGIKNRAVRDSLEYLPALQIDQPFAAEVELGDNRPAPKGGRYSSGK